MDAANQQWINHWQVPNFWPDRYRNSNKINIRPTFGNLEMGKDRLTNLTVRL